MIILFLFQLLAHVAVIWAVFNFELVHWLVSIGIYFLTGCLGVSITLHRYHSHRSFDFKFAILERIGSLLSVWGLIGSPMAWVNNHRAHHRYTDRAHDPHSPSILGFVRVQWFSMFTSVARLKYVRILIKDPWHCWVHKNYFIIHATILITLLLTCGILWTATLYLVPAAILWNAGSLINNLCHGSFGYINHKLNDFSKNNFILGYLVWGEGWHNNHHYRPANKTFKEKAWEFDLSYQIIRLVER